MSNTELPTENARSLVSTDLIAISYKEKFAKQIVKALELDNIVSS